jgi:hypothetical protein
MVLREFHSNYGNSAFVCGHADSPLRSAWHRVPAGAMWPGGRPGSHWGGSCGYCLSRNTSATFFLSSGESSSGPSFTVSLSMVPVKRNGTW